MDQIRSKEDKEKFTSDGYTYVFDGLSKNGTKHFWHCEQKHSCNSRIHTLNGKVIKRLNGHTHDTQAEIVEEDKIARIIKRKAEVELQRPNKIYKESAVAMSGNSQESLPKHYANPQVVHRRKTETAVAPPDFDNLERLVIPRDYTMFGPYEVNEKFLLADSGPSSERILIFGRQRSLNLLSGCYYWHADGTYPAKPSPFAQIYAIMVEETCSYAQPAIFALLPNKQHATYVRLFTMISKLQRNFQPKRFFCDFEQNEIEAVREVYPNVQVRGSFFHVLRSVKKIVANLGLTGRYQQDEEFALRAKMVAALALVPIHRLDEAINKLKDYFPKDQLQSLLQFFEEDFVIPASHHRITRRIPKFPPETWNAYYEILDRSRHYAEDILEASYRSLQWDLRIGKPTVWKVIDRFRKIHDDRFLTEMQISAGHKPPERFQRYKNTKERILEIVENFASSKNILDYLRSLASVCEMDA